MFKTPSKAILVNEKVEFIGNYKGE